MSATDYRRLIDIGDNPLIGVECTDGIYIRLTLFDLNSVKLDAAGARALATALTEAAGHARG